MRRSAFNICILLALLSCTDYRKVDEKLFIGTWQVEGRTIYKGMQVQIIEEGGKLKGYLSATGSNKYALLFLDSGNIWITDIERTSNFSFKMKERKIAGDLFSLYGLDATSTFHCTFSEDYNRINLNIDNNSSKKESQIYYRRIP